MSVDGATGADGADPGDPLPAPLRRLGVELIDLNERIARLAISLGACLATEADVQRILDRDVEPLRAPDIPAAFGGDGERHRLRREWDELRGLLNLRCDLMSNALQTLGVEATRQLTALVEGVVQRDGFAPGADGFQMHRWLNGADPGR